MDMSNRTCEDHQVPRQTTGNTPLRNVRLPDDVWLPALAKAEAEDTTITSVVEAPRPGDPPAPPPPARPQPPGRPRPAGGGGAAAAGGRGGRGRPEVAPPP